MALPQIRVNAFVPFPSRVSGSGMVKVTKANGVWTISLDFSQVQVVTPLPADFPVTYLFAWNSATGAYQIFSLESFIASFDAVFPTNVSAVNSPYAVTPDDTLIYVDTSVGPVTINLGLQANRAGVPISIKDVTGNAAANNISLATTGGETIEGLANPVVLSAPYAGIRLNPRTGGYIVAP